eukprot:2087146-Prymnesium_polylepis.1
MGRDGGVRLLLRKGLHDANVPYTSNVCKPPSLLRLRVALDALRLVVPLKDARKRRVGLVRRH